jgi:hypothetical protein
VRTLAVTQNITVDGSVEMLDDWFNPQGQADTDNSDLLEELHRQDSRADAFLVGRRTLEDLRGYWPGRSRRRHRRRRLPQPGPEIRCLLDHHRPEVAELHRPRR